ncbi:NUDIX domain-containing protein [Terasakiella pusilla]|uniref:NUDIX domain-containing protein n=1 Tax=Terasakiella pusilla TaxID=64973 RepID=UPI003AA8626F
MSNIVKITKRTQLQSGYYPLLQTSYRFQKFDGTWSHEIVRETVQRGDVVCVLPYDPAQQCFILIEQLRIAAVLEAERNGRPATGRVIEAVSGCIDDGESPEQAARRELHEESGLIAREMIDLGSVLTNPGMCDERLYFYIALVEAPMGEGTFGIAEEGEDIRLQYFEQSALETLLSGGRIDKAGALLLLYKFRAYLNR